MKLDPEQIVVVAVAMEAPAEIIGITRIVMVPNVMVSQEPFLPLIV